MNLGVNNITYFWIEECKEKPDRSIFHFNWTIVSMVPPYPSRWDTIGTQL